MISYSHFVLLEICSEIYAHTYSVILIINIFLSLQAPLQPPPGASAAAAAAAAVAAASGTAQSLKLTYPETLDRIKEEFQFLQTQYHRYDPHKHWR